MQSFEGIMEDVVRKLHEVSGMKLLQLFKC